MTVSKFLLKKFERVTRSKVAIWTDTENVDPVGSCVGQRGSRIQTIIGELGGEKIDIIEYNDDPAKFITNALAPAKIIDINLIEAEHKAIVKVSSDKLSLAIGKSGQNVRLAARLTNWKIDIIEASPEGEKKIIGVDEDMEIVDGEGLAEIKEEGINNEIDQNNEAEKPVVKKEKKEKREKKVKAEK